MGDGGKTIVSGLIAAVLVGCMAFFVLVINHTETTPVTAEVDDSLDNMEMDLPALSDEQVEDAYRTVLDNYRNHTGDINENYDREELSYSFVDIMEDGYPECVIAKVDKDSYKLVDLYGFDGYQTVRLCPLPSKKINIKLLKNGLIYEANRADSVKFNAFYQILPYTTELQHRITFYSQGSSYWIKEKDGDKNSVTKEEYNSKGYPYQSLEIFEDIEWREME